MHMHVHLTHTAVSVVRYNAWVQGLCFKQVLDMLQQWSANAVAPSLHATGCQCMHRRD